MRYLFAIFFLLILPLSAEDNLLSTLRSGHPRIILTQDRIAEIKRITTTDETARRWQAALIANAEKTLEQPLISYTLENKKLLEESRTALRRISSFAALYRLTGEKRFADGARKEILNVCTFPDWNPASFLSTAEMTHAVALGYDWLHDVLPDDEKTLIREAIVTKGLKPGLIAYAKKSGWPHVKHNWNTVCNDGLIIGALAVAESDPETSNAILAAAKASLPKGYLDYAPDGGWPEGPGYWDYGTTYAVHGLAALTTALGTDWNLAASPGFATTGDFRIQLISPSGMNFNFADAPVSPSGAPAMFWLARRFQRPDFDAAERLLAEKKPDIFHLIWFNPEFSTATAAAGLAKQPLSRRFTGVDVAVLRSGKNEATTFLGIKGGSNKANHAHLDLGTFVLDAGGQRFAEELGADSYTLPGYFGELRWTYYRLRTEGQNTLVIDGANQNTTGRAEIVSFSNSPDRSSVAIDLTKAYPHAGKIVRTASLEPSGVATIDDLITLDQPSDIAWNMHTKAKAAAEGRTATLTRGKTTMKVEIVSPADATFSLSPVNFEPPQRQDPKVRKLAIKLPAKTASTRITIRFTPIHP